MSRHNFQKITFLLSAAKLEQLPIEGAEVAFVGRSNVGKSSAINAITGIRGLAKASNTPGRTQLINLFSFDERHRLVDLPGYGYAKVSAAIQERWQRMLADYLRYRACLQGLILLIDIRHPIKETDLQMLAFAGERGLRVHILLTKSDKLSRSAAHRALREIEKYAAEYGDNVTVQLFSAKLPHGVDEARQCLIRWLYT